MSCTTYMQPSQTVAEVKRTLEQQTGAPTHQQQLFLVPAEGADSDVHAEQLPDATTFAELQEHLSADRTLQLSLIVDPSAVAFDDTINAGDGLLTFSEDKLTVTNNSEDV